MREPIHELSVKLGLTSRTLRHWESEGLFESSRNAESGWRVYEDDAVHWIKVTAFLRELDIPIKDIKELTNKRSLNKLCEIIENKISALENQRTVNALAQNKLTKLLSLLSKQGADLENNVFNVLDINKFYDELNHERKDYLMTTLDYDNSKVRIVELPTMRTAYNVVVSISPEDEAMEPVIEWLKSTDLLGTARLFGGNMPPMPSKEGKTYGYGMLASIPKGIAVPDNLKEMTLPGGLYAMMESGEDISMSWQTFMKLLSKDRKYKSDRKRLCLEEHIRNDKPHGCGNEYHINLFQPIFLK